MKIKITTPNKEIKTKNYSEQKEVELNDFLKFYIESLKISFPDIKKTEMKIIEFLINQDLEIDYFSSKNIDILSNLLKTSISNIKNFIKPALIKKKLIVNVNENPKNFTANSYLLNDNIRNFVKYLKNNESDISNIEIKFDFKIIKNDNNRENN